MHAKGRTSHRDIYRVNVVNLLENILLPVMLRKQCRLCRLGKPDIVNALSDALQRSTGKVRRAPPAVRLEQPYALRKRNDNIREVQPLGLMDGHHLHALAGRWGRYGRICLIPIFQETPQIVEIPARLADANKAAELLGKRYGLYTEKVDVEGNVGVVIVDDIENDNS